MFPENTGHHCNHKIIEGGGGEGLEPLQRPSGDAPAVQTNIIMKEFDTRKRFQVSFFVVTVKINSFTSLACYSVCCAAKICQIIGLKGG